MTDTAVDFAVADSPLGPLLLARRTAARGKSANEGRPGVAPRDPADGRLAGIRRKQALLAPEQKSRVRVD